MTTLQEILEVRLAPVIEALIESYDRLGMRASGDWANSLEIRTDEDSAQILSKDYTKYLSDGRTGKNMPPVKPLEDWVRNKFGITGPAATSFAWAIAKKIEKEGTTWQSGSDLLDSVFTDSNIQAIYDDIAADMNIIIAQELLNELK